MSRVEVMRDRMPNMSEWLRVKAGLKAASTRYAVRSDSVDDQRRTPVERPRGFLRAVVLQPLLAIARDGQTRRSDPALDQVLLHRSRAPLTEGLVVLGAPLRARISF